jgi:hypothetical protein
MLGGCWRIPSELSVREFFLELRRVVSGETLEGRSPRIDGKQVVIDFGAGPGARVHGRYPQEISAMGGTPGPAPKSMQLSQPSLLSYLQRFNQKRRLHYKIDLRPREQMERPTPRLQAPTKVQRPTIQGIATRSLDGSASAENARPARTDGK